MTTSLYGNTECPVCSTVFQNKNRNKRTTYCSKACKQAAYRVAVKLKKQGIESPSKELVHEEVVKMQQYWKERKKEILKEELDHMSRRHIGVSKAKKKKQRKAFRDPFASIFKI